MLFTSAWRFSSILLCAASWALFSRVSAGSEMNLCSPSGGLSLGAAKLRTGAGVDGAGTTAGESPRVDRWGSSSWRRKISVGIWGTMLSGALCTYLSTADDDHRPRSWMSDSWIPAAAKNWAPATLRQCPPNFSIVRPASSVMEVWTPHAESALRTDLTRMCFVRDVPLSWGKSGRYPPARLCECSESLIRCLSDECHGHKGCSRMPQAHCSRRVVREPMVFVLWTGTKSWTSSPWSERCESLAEETSISRSMYQQLMIIMSATCGKKSMLNGRASRGSIILARTVTSKPCLRVAGPRPLLTDRTTSRIKARMKGETGWPRTLSWWLTAVWKYMPADV